MTSAAESVGGAAERSTEPDQKEAELLAFLASLRATRQFTDEPVSAEQLTNLIEVARWTGSARNRQPWRFLPVRDRPTRLKLSRLGNYAQHLATAPLVLVVLSEDRRWTDTGFDSGRITQTISLAAHAMGLGSCLATFHPDDNIGRAAATLGVGSPWRPHHAISLGHPAPATQSSRSAIPTGRLPVTELLHTYP